MDILYNRNASRPNLPQNKFGTLYFISQNYMPGMRARYCTNLQIGLTTQTFLLRSRQSNKNTCQVLLAKKNPSKENFKPEKKSFIILVTLTPDCPSFPGAGRRCCPGGTPLYTLMCRWTRNSF